MTFRQNHILFELRRIESGPSQTTITAGPTHALVRVDRSTRTAEVTDAERPDLADGMTPMPWDLARNTGMRADIKIKKALHAWECARR